MSDFKMAWIGEYLHANPKVILDIGAFNGEDALAFKRHYPYADVYAFEADPRNFSRCQTVASYGINIFHLAVSDYVGQTPFYSSGGRIEYEASGSTLKPTPRQLSDFPEMSFTEVGMIPCTTLWDFCTEHSIANIDLLHMDVQGAEGRVIEGMKDIRPSIVFLEKSESHHYETATSVDTLNKLMLDRGYSLVKELEFDNLYVLKDLL
jgi:2-O-methyltransferase